MLRGRHSERAALDRQLQRARAGNSSVLVVRGESGVGKTALLECVAERASGCRIVRAAGVECEMELAFAGLHQLCAPMLDGLDGLPSPQQEALCVALGLQDGAAPNGFLVALAVLSLLAEAAEVQPLVCLVDDAQWLDRASAQTLAFVARRLLAERIAMVFAVREPDDANELTGLPELNVGGLADDDARFLLASAMPGRLDERVRDQIVAETRGNPLALLELPRGLTPAELAGGFGLPGTRPLVNRIEQSFVRRVQSLPGETQQLVLLAAADPVGDAPLLWRAAHRLGIGPGALAPAEAAGLLEVGARVRFRHPLVRSAAYRAAGWTERQDTHRALAEATDPERDPDRRAWHRAQATAGLDEKVAVELERSAGRAQNRGGVAAAAAFLARAAELTPDPAARGVRALAAAQAKFDAAATDSALELLAIADIAPLDEFQRARLERLRAQIMFTRTRGGDAVQLLLGAAKQLEPLDAALAREAYLEAFRAAMSAGRLIELPGIGDAAEAARAAPAGPGPPRAIDLLLDGLATRFTKGYEAGVAPLRRALDAFRREEGRSEAGMRWLWLACPVAPEPVAPDLWDDETWHRLAARAVTLARDAGALSVLPTALTSRAVVHLLAGEFSAAAELIGEADAITEATGSTPLTYTSLLLAAWRGQEARALELFEAAVQDANARGEGRAIGVAECATAVLYNGLGRHETALAAAQRACEYEDLGLFAWALAELVEAAARGGTREVGTAALRQLEEQANAVGTDWALGIQARSRALASEGEAAERLYREAIERLGRSRIAVHRARAQLLYGEWLRRESRRLDAREQLRAAYEMFSRMGAEAFAARARRELAATGEKVRKRTVETRDELTAQERQIASLARDRLSNPEIGARLFLSPRTVEWHLRKVYGKLGIKSRRELRDQLAPLQPVS